MRFIVATHNYKKLAELSRILKPLNIDALTDAELNIELDEVEETGTTFKKNAYIKAFAACKQTGIPAVADDSGLEVDALNGAPGVYSARYAGEGTTDLQRNQKLLSELADVPDEKRTAHFVSVICCVFPNGDCVTVRGECLGRIGFNPQGDNGFGYDPIFIVDSGQSYAQLSADEKDSISHRGNALRLFAVKLQEYLNCHCAGKNKANNINEKDGINLLTSKQRAFLRSMANTMDPILHVGKGDISDTIIKQADDALTAREIIKGKVLEACPLSSREVADKIAQAVNAQVVQVIGRTFVIYRRNKKEPKIILPNEKR